MTTVLTMAAFVQDALAGRNIGPGVDRARIAECRLGLETAFEAILAEWPDGPRPVRLTKQVLADVLACEVGALARRGRARSEPSVPLVVGQLLDQVVAWIVLGGTVPEPAAAFDLALDMLRTEGRTDTIEWLAAQPDDVARTVRADVDRRVDALAMSWPALGPEWWPRLEDRALVTFARGQVVASARFDLLLGGGASERPKVLVEVKSGAGSGVHRPDLFWYALLCALRDDEAPQAVATWAATSNSLSVEPVRADTLEAAARRTVAGVERLLALASGRSPSVTPYPGCLWCPARPECPDGQRAVARGFSTDLETGLEDASELDADDGDADGDGDGDLDDDG